MPLLCSSHNDTTCVLNKTLPNQPISINKYILIVENPLLNKSGFPVDTTTFSAPDKNFHLVPQEEYWIKFRIQDTLKSSPLWVGFGPQHRVDIYDQKNHLGAAGNGVNQDATMHPPHRHWMQLPDKNIDAKTYLFRLKTDPLSDPLPLMPRLATLSHLDAQHYKTIHNQQKKYAFYWSIMVIIGFLALVSIAQFFFNHDKTYLFYGFYLAFNFIYLVFIFERNSVYSIFLKKYVAEYQHALIIPTLMLSYYFYTQFIRHILNTKVVHSKFDRLLRYFGNTTLVFLVLDIIIGIVIHSHYYLQLRNLILIGTFLFAIGCLFALLGIKSKVARLVFIGTLIFSIGSFLGFLFSTLITLPEQCGMWADGYAFMEVGVGLEVLFFSVALAYRSRQLEKDKNLAKAQLIRENYENEKLRYENEKREEFEAVRSQFFADTNHELRTPLTVIQGTAEMLNSNPEKRNIILKHTQSMIEMINNMLDINKVEIGKLEVHKIQDDIIPFLKEHINAWSQYANHQEIELNFFYEQDSLILDFDDKKMTQILNNLFSNSVKFTPQKGIINLTVLTKEDQLIISVEDTGMGIKAEDITMIFDRYYQPAKQPTTHIKGTGIGLALVQQLVLLMEGTITVSSLPDKGTTFEMVFPITRNAPLKKAELPLTPVIPVTRIDTMIGSQKDHSISNPLILVVEDDPSVLQLLVSTLRVVGYTIITATTGNDGIVMAQQHNPDLIISDVVMPNGTGYELCKTIKEEFDTSHIPVILLTAKVGETNKIKGLQQGADAYLTKPFSQEELLLRIENLIDIRKKLHERFSDNLDEASIKESTLSKHDQELLDKLTQYIKANFKTGKLGVNHLQNLTNTSRSTLHRKLISITGKSTSQFKKQVIMQEAKRLLKTKDYTIAELADHLGFSQPSNFSREFKEYYGESPTTYLN